MTLCVIEDDDLVHVVAAKDSLARGRGQTAAVCGRAALALLAGDVVRQGEGCHVCLPQRAHPLAAVWDACRRLDSKLWLSDSEPSHLELRT